MLRFGIPVLFVVIWSSGFIVAKAAAPHADLQLYIAVRLSLTAVVMGLAAVAAGAVWPRGRQFGSHILAGALMQGVYLCASYWAIGRGMAAGVMALLGALQPVFTALFLAARGAQLGARTWVGLFVGFGGVALVLAPKLMSTGTGSLTVLTVASALFSVVAVTAGALVQKHLSATDIRTAASIQNLGGFAVAVIVTLLVGTGQWDNTPILWGALVWAVLVPSVVGTTLLMWMMRHGEATKVTALVLLAPPLAAVQAYFFFGETLLLPQFAGFALTLGGVLLARSSAPSAPVPKSAGSAQTTASSK
jgi:drug/metabolite transporter (DMT)-like permease